MKQIDYLVLEKSEKNVGVDSDIDKLSLKPVKITCVVSLDHICPVFVP